MKKNFKKNKMSLIGIDEVNYSPSLAGDCVICALYALKKVRGIKDSKQLTHKQRLKLFGKLHYQSVYSVVPATVNSINSVGIYKARNYAIASALENLYLQLLGMNIKPEKAVIDGPFSKGWMNYFKSKIAISVECMVNADEIIYQVSAASIVARIYADALFTGFGSFYPAVYEGKLWSVMVEKNTRGKNKMKRFKRAIRQLLLRLRFLQNLQYHQVDWDVNDTKEDRDSEIEELKDAIDVLNEKK